MEAFFVSTSFSYLDTSKTSTRVGKKEAKEEPLLSLRPIFFAGIPAQKNGSALVVLGRHISIVAALYISVKYKKFTCPGDAGAGIFHEAARHARL